MTWTWIQIRQIKSGWSSASKHRFLWEVPAEQDRFFSSNVSNVKMYGGEWDGCCTGYKKGFSAVNKTEGILCIKTRRVRFVCRHHTPCSTTAWTGIPSTPWTRWAPCTTSISRRLNRPSTHPTTGRRCTRSRSLRGWLVSERLGVT